MPFYPPNPRRRPFSPGNSSRFGSPNRMRRQPRLRPFSNSTQKAPRLQGLQKVMGHVGTVTNGVNMLRQMGSFLKFFK